MSNTVRSCIVMGLYTLVFFAVLWVVSTNDTSLFPLIFCAVGGGILCYGRNGFYALHTHALIGGRYGNDAFYRFFTRMYALGCVSVPVVGTADSIGTPTLMLVIAVPVGMASLFYVAFYSVRMQHVDPLVPYVRNAWVYPAQTALYVSLCDRVSPFTGWVEVCTSVFVRHPSISEAHLLVRVLVPQDTIPPEGVPLLTLQRHAIEILRHDVEGFFARIVAKGAQEVDTTSREFKQTLTECGFQVLGATFVDKKPHPTSPPHRLPQVSVA